MIKLYRDSAEQLAMCLHYILYRAGVEMNEVQHGVGRTNNLSGKEIGALKRSLRASPSTLTPVKEQFDHLIQAINDEDIPNKDGDLIDLMVQTLQLPHVQNVLAGGRLNQLKKAILLPSEFGALAERVRAREMSCGHCGSQFRDGEAVTLRHSGDRTSPGIVYCAACVKPDVIVCPGCKKLCAIQKMGTGDFLCPSCTDGPKKEKGKSLKKAVADFTGRPGGAGTNTVRGGAIPVPTETRAFQTPQAPGVEAQGGQEVAAIGGGVAGLDMPPARPQFIVRPPEPRGNFITWQDAAAEIAMTAAQLNRPATPTVATTGGALTYDLIAQTAADVRDMERRARTYEAVADELFRQQTADTPAPPMPMAVEAEFDDMDFDNPIQDLP